MKGTTDAFLFAHQNTEFVNGGIQVGAVIELFVARGQRNNRSQLYNTLSDGGLDEEMNALRMQVTKTVTEPEKPCSLYIKLYSVTKSVTESKTKVVCYSMCQDV